MNKTIIINISGIIFHIEEDAYEVLKSYMNDVKRHFSKSEDSFEIVTDIENRVAEMFSELLQKESKQVITIADVSAIVAQMGKTSEFEDATEEHSSAPIEEEVKHSQKRLYRDPEDKILGGVCSGIAAYFNTDPLWIRLALAITVFVFGTGILLYILLWIIMPEAKTRGEKLSMRGEKINIDTIKKSIEKEISSANKNFNGGDQIKGFIQNIVELFGKLFVFIFKIVGKLAGLLLLFMGLSFAIAAVVLTLGGLGLAHVDMPQNFPFNILEPGFNDFTFVSWFVVAIIPVAAIIFLAIRIVFNVKILNKTAALGMLGVWVFGLLMAGYFTVKAAEEFREVGKLKQTNALHAVTGNTFYLMSSHSEYNDYDEDTINTKRWGVEGKIVIKSDEEHAFFHDNDWNNIDLNIERSPDTEIKLITVYTSRGKDQQSAVQSASMIEYNFVQEDSVLLFPNFFSLKKNAKWRNQEIEMTLFIPENMKLVIQDRVDHFIRNIYSGNCERTSANETTWMMKKDGLVCKEAKEENDSTYNHE